MTNPQLSLSNFKSPADFPISTLLWGNLSPPQNARYNRYDNNKKRGVAFTSKYNKNHCKYNSNCKNTYNNYKKYIYMDDTSQQEGLSMHWAHWRQNYGIEEGATE